MDILLIIAGLVIACLSFVFPGAMLWLVLAGGVVGLAGVAMNHGRHTN